MLFSNNNTAMTTRFVQVSWGLQYTDTFLHIDTIKAYIQCYQKGQPVDSSTAIAESIASSSQDRMNEEIHQHIRISNALAKEELYDYLTGWINYFERNLKSSQYIESQIKIYNEKRLKEYEDIVTQEEEKFKQTDNYKKLNHLDFYEVKSSMMGGFLGTQGFFGSPSRLQQYRKFFSAPDPDLIDIEYLPQYHTEIVRPFLARCVNIATKRLSYLKGDNDKNMLPESTVINPKQIVVENHNPSLKVGMTVEQLAFLFRSLKRVGLVKGKDIDIANFIVAHFHTTARTGKKISAANLVKLFSTKDPAIINFWIARFQEMEKDSDR